MYKLLGILPQSSFCLNVGKNDHKIWASGGWGKGVPTPIPPPTLPLATPMETPSVKKSVSLNIHSPKCVQIGIRNLKTSLDLFLMFQCCLHYLQYCIVYKYYGAQNKTKLILTQNYWLVHNKALPPLQVLQHHISSRRQNQKPTLQGN